ncbi:MAG: tryptophan halogenase [Gammaproteobacteria bacterium]|nr:MAG: tryptophan halogenase [Gammaproteobacteria bacterium]
MSSSNTNRLTTKKSTTNFTKPFKNIVILGGGTAGWMAANLMALNWQSKGINITLVESPAIGTVGVGEGSTPQLKTFFDKIGVSENEWMPRCNATYKNGILFKNWSTRPSFEQYFHPFASPIDAHSAPAFIYNSVYRRQSADVDSHPDRFFLAAYLAKHHKTAIPDHNFPFPISYGYHFDSNLLGKFLVEKAIARGVKHLQATVSKVHLHTNTANNNELDGCIESLELDDGRKLFADLFVDCSGFRAELIQNKLKVPFISFKENLFNDSAVTLSTPAKNHLNSQTISTAMKHGWAWDIPLRNRTGNGYVYSSDYCSADQAETELRAKLGLLNSDVEARHLKMKVGRVKQHWAKNCLAVGLSQGFIEPLEATALHLVQETIENFIDVFSAGSFTDAHQDSFNDKINERFDGIRDYIVAHYRLNSREDTQYWHDNAANPNISQHLKSIIQAWLNGEDLNKTLAQSRQGQEKNQNEIISYYPPVSWHCILAGYGIFPPSLQKVSADHPAHKYDLKHIDDFIERCGLNFKDHLQFLNTNLM